MERTRPDGIENVSVDSVSLYSTSDLHVVFLNSCDSGWWEGAIYKVGTFTELSRGEVHGGRIYPISEIRKYIHEEEATRQRQAMDIKLMADK